MLSSNLKIKQILCKFKLKFNILTYRFQKNDEYNNYVSLQTKKLAKKCIYFNENSKLQTLLTITIITSHNNNDDDDSQLGDDADDMYSIKRQSRKPQVKSTTTTITEHLQTAECP